MKGQAHRSAPTVQIIKYSMFFSYFCGMQEKKLRPLPLDERWFMNFENREKGYLEDKQEGYFVEKVNETETIYNLVFIEPDKDIAIICGDKASHPYYCIGDNVIQLQDNYNGTKSILKDNQYVQQCGVKYCSTEYKVRFFIFAKSFTLSQRLDKNKEYVGYINNLDAIYFPEFKDKKIEKIDIKHAEVIRCIKIEASFKEIDTISAREMKFLYPMGGTHGNISIQKSRWLRPILNLQNIDFSKLALNVDDFDSKESNLMHCANVEKIKFPEQTDVKTKRHLLKLLGILLKNNNYLPEAEAVFDEEMKIYGKILQEQHPFVDPSWVIKIYNFMKKYWQKIKKIFQIICGKKRPYFLRSDYLILKLSDWFSDFGKSLWLPLFWIFIFGVLGYTFQLIGQDKFALGCPTGKEIEGFFKFIFNINVENLIEETGAWSILIVF